MCCGFSRLYYKTKNMNGMAELLRCSGSHEENVLLFFKETSILKNRENNYIRLMVPDTLVLG